MSAVIYTTPIPESEPQLVGLARPNIVIHAVWDKMGDAEQQSIKKLTPSRKTPAVSLAKPNMVPGAEMDKMGRINTEPQVTRETGDQQATFKRSPDK